MLSNADTQDDFFERAFVGYHIHKIFANRAINCNGDKRGKVSELLITNYQYELNLGVQFLMPTT